LSSVHDGPATTDAAAESDAWASVPWVAVPDTVAVFTTEPASTSGWVVVYVFPVQDNVTEAAGANEPAGAHDNPDSNGSAIAMSSIVTFPVFVTVNPYVNTTPGAA
jgi:hypothetical protein